MEDREKYGSYEAIIDSWGYEVKHCDMTGSYQGDYLASLYDDNEKKWGFLVVGYGSCSGCDTLEAISPSCWHYNHDTGKEEPCNGRCDWSEVKKFSDELKQSVYWDYGPRLAEFLADEERQELQWYWHDEEIRNVLLKFIQTIGATIIGKTEAEAKP